MGHPKEVFDVVALVSNRNCHNKLLFWISLKTQNVYARTDTDTDTQGHKGNGRDNGYKKRRESEKGKTERERERKIDRIQTDDKDKDSDGQECPSYRTTFKTLTCSSATPQA